MIRVVDVHKRFGALEVLKGVSFDVHRGNVVSMIGASGSGKSTLLRCINYLEVPTAGDIFIEGESLKHALGTGTRFTPREVIDILLDIVGRDRDWNEGAARQRLLQLIEPQGLEDPWARTQRRRLSALLFT